MRLLGAALIFLCSLILYAQIQNRPKKNPVTEPPQSITVYDSESGTFKAVNKIYKSNSQWRKILTPEQYHITREGGTERAFTGKYHHSKDTGIYQCVSCGTDLFDSKTKFDSKTGWPSFSKPVAQENIRSATDKSFNMVRTEILCGNCGGHLGHLFNDGPTETGMRYCINSVSLDFDKEKEKE